MPRNSKRKAQVGVGISRALKKRVEPAYLASTDKLNAAITKAKLYLQAGEELEIEGISFGKHVACRAVMFKMHVTISIYTY